ncbi:hypothetical protein AB835_10785 [Candidatus Endobugula sertula]|uniref:Topoisomerase II n=1 Tax=Candidatus Endobugula sertula TaxID=62101 RepID=A0A1D2QNC8_9GAMM|nr:hypothetical protein AB835_10785 [Candidatus Endobugula sertula]
MNKQVLISISISADEYLRVYQGSAKTVSTLDRQGKRVRFPVNILQPYITHNGVSGVFAIEFDENNKFKRIARC